jgi:hypothetical protein
MGTSCHILEAFADNTLSQHSSRGRTITGYLTGFGGHFLDQLGTHVFKRVFKLNFLGDRNPILGDVGGTKFFSMMTLRPLGPKVTLTVSAN